jgi:phosphoribosylglycinamide formyltransferase 1
MSKRLLRIAVLISGGGTTLKNLIDRQAAGKLPVEFRLVVSSRSDAGGLNFAHQANIASVVLVRSAFPSTEAYSEAIFDACRRAEVDLVVMGGFLKHVLIPADFAGRVINIHPSLIPSFCGKGFYGLRVHEAALEYGVRISGCTAHLVDDEYDHGPILLQRACPVLDDDTPESLQRRVFDLECEVLPEAILKWARTNDRSSSL